MQQRLLKTIPLALVLLGCGGNTSGTRLLAQQECNPLGGNGCITPWPSNLYAASDSSTSSGMRLDIPEGALPTSADGIPIDPAPLNAMDGFSAAAPMIVAFEGGVDGSNLVPHARYPDSLGDDSPTVLIDMTTGERVAHFAELDIREADRTDRQALYIRSAMRLRPSTRYAVAIRKSLKDLDGADLPLSPGFAAILSGKTTGHDRLEARRAAYNEVLSAMETSGISRDDLVVAWDFTTASDASIRRDLLAVRERTLAAAGEDGANLSYTVVEDELIEEGAFRRVRGTFLGPLVLSNDGRFITGTTALRDGEGLPEVIGMAEIPFTTVIPSCALEGSGPVSIIVHGHGLLGDDSQAGHGAMRALSAHMCAIIVGTTMRGMSSRDIPNVLLTLNNYNSSDQIFGTLLQGMANHLALVQAIRGPMAETLYVDGDGLSIVDTDRIHYYGLSQGHIFGTTVVAYDPHITRAVLGSGGANYSMMLERSRDWPTYRTVLIGAYEDPLNVSIMLGLLQMRWDTTEGTNVIADMPGTLFPGTPDKQFLLHMAIADAEVPNVSTEYQARTMGLSVLGPAVYVPYGVTESEGPLSSGLVIFDGGFGPIPAGNVAPDENDAHYLSRSAPAALRQMQHFFDTGEIIQTCTEGMPCDCTTDACK